MGFSRVPNLLFLDWFSELESSLILLDPALLQVDKEVIKGREDMARGAKGGDYSRKYGNLKLKSVRK